MSDDGKVEGVLIHIDNPLADRMSEHAVYVDDVGHCFIQDRPALTVDERLLVLWRDGKMYLRLPENVRTVRGDQ